MLTTRPDKHLYLDMDGYLHIFWDFTEEIGGSLDVYKHHFLWDKTGRASESISSHIQH